MQPYRTVTGRCSTFGGPADRGVRPEEGVALYSNPSAPAAVGLFLAPALLSGIAAARLLDPRAFYCACRWNYGVTPLAVLRASWVLVEAGTRRAFVRPVDWGPNERTGRVIDLSPGAAAYLGVGTDAVVQVTLMTSNRTLTGEVSQG